MITPQQFTVTEDQCYQETMDLCYEGRESCYKPCLTYGPEVIAFDEKTNKLYLAVTSTAVGTTGVGPRFVFIADINKKEIKLLTSETIGRSGEVSLSSSGKYLLVRSFNRIEIINTNTGEASEISEENNGCNGQERLHYLGHIKWLNDTQFSYQDGIRHDKFQKSYDDKKENIYDIPTKKIISSRVMAKTEMD